MRVTRSYWMGLGSGLILSALLALVFYPPQGQALTPQTPAVANSADQKTTPEVSNDTLKAEQSKVVELSAPTQSELEFVIPNGASAVQIADLLLAQGFITDKQGFLDSAHSNEVEKKFKAGTYTLSSGLTLEQLMGRLVQN